MPRGRCGYGADAAARFCAQCGAPLDAAADTPERRHATIVFRDLCGYTALNERLDPEEVEEILGRVKVAAQQVVERHGGVVNQFVGDEVMAVFGVPVARRDDAARAVRAALELHREVGALSAEVSARAGGPIAVHTGISSGLVVARRSDERSGRYQLTGDAVNTAARLLKLAADGEIVVGQETWREVAHRFDGEARSATEVKGKERPLGSWLVVGERAAQQQPTRPLVGRHGERARFEALARRCARRRRRWHDRPSRRPRHRQDTARRGVRPRRRRAGFRDPPCTGARLQRRARGRCGAGPGARPLRGRAAGGGGARAAGPPGEPAGRRAHPEQRTLAAAMSEEVRLQGTRAALCDLAREAARRRPQLLLVEDLRWADAWTLDHVATLVTLAGSAPIVLLATARREADPTAALRHRAAPGAPQEIDVLDLGPLDAQDMSLLAEQIATTRCAGWWRIRGRAAACCSSTTCCGPRGTGSCSATR